ncbi:pyridoxamine 5'-phosphate oxidase family protein [Streptomyces sp. P38-E01]|uniref:Pyridoxamine 5'-phosphate oxidase family protein n=1 Tax=Streptomyces tardus TaxID=2780544 RepID=A0A949JRW1_9ACTN|nr:pyridoxamine 5'-phosphate oxidase family protein [Streptomyces tardus]MBU7599035.1 pyridoxamine 5'-phosphate oxidase family protein [Streptomyces tardus]
MAKNGKPPREASERKQDTLRRLDQDTDAWVATASPQGAPCMVPLSFVHHRGVLLMCTRSSTPTARNIGAGSAATIAVGPTRDVVLIKAEAELVPSTEMGGEVGDAFAAKLNWDPRDRPAWTFLRFTPHTLLAWREENELAERLLLSDGDWLV